MLISFLVFVFALFLVLGAYLLATHGTDKKRARLNCIRHLLSQIPYKKVARDKIKLPKRSMKGEYDDVAPLRNRRFVPNKY